MKRLRGLTRGLMGELLLLKPIWLDRPCAKAYGRGTRPKAVGQGLGRGPRPKWCIGLVPRPK